MNLASLQAETEINEIINFFNSATSNYGLFDEITWNRHKRIAESLKGWSKYCGLALLYSLKKDSGQMLKCFDIALSYSVNEVLINAYLGSLIRNGFFSEALDFFTSRIDEIFIIENISCMMFIATIFGDLAMLDKLNDRLGKLFYNQQQEYGEQMKAFTDNQDAVKSAYQATGCTQEQIKEIANITSEIIKKYKANAAEINVSDRGGGAYIINIDTNDYEQIVEMNFDLAKKASRSKILSDCELVAIFEIYQAV